MSAEPNNQRPAALRRGWLRHGNPPGDFMAAPRCGAKTRQGLPCGCSAMRNGRCRLHGGLSTGPRTPEGLKALGQARTVHGFYSRSALEQRRHARTARRRFGHLLDQLRA
jgi:hypothetical protein